MSRNYGFHYLSMGVGEREENEAPCEEEEKNEEDGGTEGVARRRRRKGKNEVWGFGFSYLRS